MTLCCVCDADIGHSIIITQTNIGPLCKDCFDYYLRDRKGFLESLKSKEDSG